MLSNGIWKRIDNFIPHFIGHLDIYLPILGLKFTVVKSTLGIKLQQTQAQRKLCP